jgi:hypothetical protein
MVDFIIVGHYVVKKMAEYAGIGRPPIINWCAVDLEAKHVVFGPYKTKEKALAVIHAELEAEAKEAASAET